MEGEPARRRDLRRVADGLCDCLEAMIWVRRLDERSQDPPHAPRRPAPPARTQVYRLHLSPLTQKSGHVKKGRSGACRAGA